MHLPGVCRNEPNTEAVSTLQAGDVIPSLGRHAGAAYARALKTAAWPLWHGRQLALATRTQTQRLGRLAGDELEFPGDKLSPLSVASVIGSAKGGHPWGHWTQAIQSFGPSVSTKLTPKLLQVH